MVSPTNAHPEALPLLGRDEELAQLVRELRDGATLITLLGPAGVGKTRLARAAVEKLQMNVRQFSVAGTRTRDEVVARISAALGLSLRGATSEDDDEAIAIALRSLGRVLVVVDEAEGPAPAVAEFVATLTARAQGTSFLITSRARLGVPFERLFELAPLGRDAAVELLTRAVNLASRSPRSEDETETLIKIVEALDGLPLALELAAPRMRVLTPAQLLSRLERSLELLRVDRPKNSQRHTSLRAVLGESWELLSARERRAAARLSVFRASFGLEAAETVLRARADEDAVELLQALRDKSMLIKEPGAAGAVRFRMLTTIRLHAEENRLARDADRDAELDHARWFALHGGPSDLADLVEATRRASLAAPEIALKVAIRAAGALMRSGPLRLGEELLSQALERGIEACPADTVAAALVERARLRVFVGRAAEGLADAARGRSLAVASATLRAKLDTAWVLASTHVGEADEAARHLVAVRPGYEGEAALEIDLSLSMVLLVQRRLDQARLTARDAVAAARELGLSVLEARASSLLGAITYLRGDPVEARAASERAAALFTIEGDPVSAARAWGNAGLAALDQGGSKEGRWLLESAVTTAERAGSTIDWIGALVNLAALETLEDRPRAARACLARALPFASGGLKALVLHEIAKAALCEGLFEEAVDLLARADRIGGGSVFAVVAPRVAVLSAVAAHLAGQGVAARAALDRAKAQLDGDRVADAMLEVARAAIEGGPSQSPPREFAEVRVLLRVLAPREMSSTRISGVVIDRRRMTLKLPTRAAIALGTRGRQRRIFDALVTQRSSAPGVGLSVEALFAAGWPGERAIAESATNRVYVAVAGLRKLGLRDLILRRDDGYLLDPTVEMLVEG